MRTSNSSSVHVAGKFASIVANHRTNQPLVSFSKSGKRRLKWALNIGDKCTPNVAQFVRKLDLLKIFIQMNLNIFYVEIVSANFAGFAWSPLIYVICVKLGNRGKSISINSRWSKIGNGHGWFLDEVYKISFATVLKQVQSFEQGYEHHELLRQWHLVQHFLVSVKIIKSLRLETFH